MASHQEVATTQTLTLWKTLCHHHLQWRKAQLQAEKSVGYADLNHFAMFGGVLMCFFHFSSTLRFLHVSFKRKRMRRAQGMAVDPADRRSAYSKGVDQRGRGPVLAGGEGRKL